nr:reverse transcriptase domain-containing protein [Tanacetum cinerariifolium]
MQDAIEFTTELMNKKINTWAKRQADNKRKSDDTTRNNHQQPNKRQNTGRAYAAGDGERKEYAGTLPLCNKCKFHHNGQCTIKSDCSKLKNQDHGNQAGGTRAHGMRRKWGMSKNEGCSPLFIVLKTLGGQGNFVAKFGQLSWRKRKRCGHFKDQEMELWCLHYNTDTGCRLFPVTGLLFLHLGDLVGLLYPNRLGICIPPRQGIVGFLLGLSAFAMAAACASRTAATPSVISCRIAALIIAGVADSGGGVIDLTDDEDPTDEDGDTGMDDSTGVSTSLGGEISSG